MSGTIFPVLPRDVAVLTRGEFAFDFQADAPSLDDVCRLFEDDANRALVWVIRSRALKAWCAGDGIAAWLTPARMPHVCEVAAGFELNERWEFDADCFCHAVDTIANRVSRQG